MTWVLDGETIDVVVAALEQTRSSACITDADLDAPGPQILYVNQAYCAMTGRSREQVVGSTPRLMQGPLTDRATLDRLRSNLTQGRSFAGETINYRGDGTPFVISWSIDPVRNEDGIVTHFVATQEDVTQLRRAERRLEVLGAVDAAVTEVLSAVAETSDWDDDQLLRAIGQPIAEAVAAFAGTASAALRMAGPNGAVIDIEGGTDNARLTLDRVGSSPTGPLILDGSGYLARPISDREDERLGFLAAIDPDQHRLDFVDQEGLDLVAHRVGEALGALDEYGRQRRIALTLQRDLLPVEVQCPPLEVAARYLPGAVRTVVGGDWFDTVSEDGVTVLVVGDVAGSGIEAAVTMGRLRTLTRALLLEGQPIERALTLADRICAAEFLFATVVVIRIDHQRRCGWVSSAGHPPPLLRRAGSTQSLAVPPDPPLGVGSTKDRGVMRFELEAGDALLLYTDGVVERRGAPIDAGIDWLISEVDRAGQHPEEICETVLGAVSGAGSDDMALLAVRWPTDLE